MYKHLRGESFTPEAEKFASLRHTSHAPEIGDQIFDKIIESLTKQKNELQLRCLKLEDQFKAKEQENLSLRKDLTDALMEKNSLIQSHRSELDSLIVQHK